MDPGAAEPPWRVDWDPDGDFLLFVETPAGHVSFAPRGGPGGVGNLAIRTRAEGDPSVAQLEVLLAELAKLMEHPAFGPCVITYDFRDYRTPEAALVPRIVAPLLDWVRAWNWRLDEVALSAAVLFRGFLVRGIVSAVMKLVKPACPTHFCADDAEAARLHAASLRAEPAAEPAPAPQRQGREDRGFGVLVALALLAAMAAADRPQLLAWLAGDQDASPADLMSCGECVGLRAGKPAPLAQAADKENQHANGGSWPRPRPAC